MFSRLLTAYYIRKCEKTIKKYRKVLQQLPFERKLEVINDMTNTIKSYIPSDNEFIQEFCSRMLVINIQTLIEMGYDTVANLQTEMLHQIKGRA